MNILSEGHLSTKMLFSFNNFNSKHNFVQMVTLNDKKITKNFLNYVRTFDVIVVTIIWRFYVPRKVFFCSYAKFVISLVYV